VEIPYFKGERPSNGLKARTDSSDGSVANFEGKAFDRRL